MSFWEDLWNDQILANKFPIIHSFANNSNISVQEIMSADDLDSLFYLPLSLPINQHPFFMETFLIAGRFRIWETQKSSIMVGHYSAMVTQLQEHRLITSAWELEK